MPSSFKPSQHRYKRGFTLFEVLIALGIIAIALTALAGFFNQANKNNNHLRDTTIGNWVASDILNRYRIYNNWPRSNLANGSYQQAGQQWDWQLSLIATSADNIFRARLTVFHPGTRNSLAIQESYFNYYTRSLTPIVSSD